MSVLELRSISKVYGKGAAEVLPSTGGLALVIGMPLIAAVAGWLIGGRAPAAFARQPLE